ncbi:hypothetical protein [Sphingobium phenoxybenzoativorans]|nr:hypothetical protein [Sphingobium phenoxybenzoativorans]
MRTTYTKRACAALIALTAMAAAGLIADSASARKPAKDDGRVAVGEPVDCIMPNRLRNTNVRDDSTIDFVMNNGDVYRNTLPNSCPSLGFEQRFSYRLSTSQLCSVDIITVLQTAGGNYMQGASCGLGKFQKMSKPAK